MEKNDYQQLELFSQAKGNNREKREISRLFLNYIWAWEKAILIIIGLAVTGIISFSLGVERGKRITQVRTEEAPPVLFIPLPGEAPSAQLPQPVKKEEPREYLPNYTIQVASFLNKTSAQKEADTLKRKGLSPMVLPKGKFNIVCVGNFSQRKDAESLLSKLKKQYQDCIIRRL